MKVLATPNKRLKKKQTHDLRGRKRWVKGLNAVSWVSGVCMQTETNK